MYCRDVVVLQQCGSDVEVGSVVVAFSGVVVM